MSLLTDLMIGGQQSVSETELQRNIITINCIADLRGVKDLQMSSFKESILRNYWFIFFPWEIIQLRVRIIYCVISLPAKTLLDFMHFAASFLQNSPVHSDGHVMSLTDIKGKSETESDVSTNSLLNFLSIL